MKNGCVFGWLYSDLMLALTGAVIRNGGAAMKAQDFATPVEQLGDLTGVQRTALAAAWAGDGSANEAMTTIEVRFASAPACGHCKSESVISWGKASGLKCYKCRDCKRTFNALTSAPLAQLHRRDAWLDDARAMVDRTSLRVAAERADICLDTSFRWRHRFFVAHPANNDAATLKTFADGQIAADSAVTTDGHAGYNAASLGPRPHEGIVPTKAERAENDAVQACHWTITNLKRWGLLPP